jgi:hypothetical protein
MPIANRYVPMMKEIVIDTINQIVSNGEWDPQKIKINQLRNYIILEAHYKAYNNAKAYCKDKSDK